MKPISALASAVVFTASLGLHAGKIAAQTSWQDIPHRSEWDHNGSRMRVERESGTNKVFLFYEDPKASLRPTIGPGARLFEGTIAGSRVTGTAHVFKRGCAPAQYPVEGTLSGASQETLTLTGPTPIWSGCAVVGFKPDGAHSRLVFNRTSSPNAAPTKPWAETASCDEQLPLIDRVIAATRVEFSTPRAGAATVGERVTVSWTTESAQRPVPVYLVVTASGPVRVDPTEHAIVLLPKARFPFGMSVEEQSTRIVVPLYGGVPRAGKLAIELLTAGPQHVRAIGIGHAQPCRETRRVSRGELALDVTAGRPTVLAAPDADIATEPKLILSSNSQRLLRVHPTWFQLIEMPGEIEIARIEGKEPRFSPTGRFVAFEAIKIWKEHQKLPWPFFNVVDTIDGKVLNQVPGEAVLWDQQDSFMVTDKGFLGKYTVFSAALGVRGHACAGGGQHPLIMPGGGARFDLENMTFDVLDEEPAKQIDGSPLVHCVAGGSTNAARIETLRTVAKAPLAGFELEHGSALFNLVKHRLEDYKQTATRVRQPRYLSATDTSHTTAQLRLTGGDFGSSMRSRRSNDNPFANLLATHLRELSGVVWRGGVVKPLRIGSGEEVLSLIAEKYPNAKKRFTMQARWPDWPCGMTEGQRAENVRGPISLAKDSVVVFEIGRSAKSELLLWQLCQVHSTETGWSYDNLHVVGVEGVTSFGPAYSNSLFKLFGVDRDEQTALADNGVWWFGDDLLLAANKITRAVELIQWSAKRTVRSWPQWPGTARLDDVMIDPSGKLLLQLDSDGSFYIHRIADGTVRLRGRIVDDEIVVWTEDGLYDASGEGAHLVNVRLPGRPGSYPFHQFERTLRVVGLAKKALAGEPLPRPTVRVPPLLTGMLESTDAGRITGKATVDAPNGARAVHVYQDGVLTDRIEQITDARNVKIDIARHPGSRWATLVAFDGQGVASQPIGRDLGPPVLPGRLSVLAIGVDFYRDQRLSKLSVAVADARRLVAAIGQASSMGRRTIGNVKSLTDIEVTRSTVITAVEEAVQASAPGDTLVLSFSGHGVRDDSGMFYLAAHDTRLSDLPGTAVSWTDLAASFAKAKGRIVVLLDACHSGMAGTQFFATNDDIAGGALAALPAHVVVFAASKGREFSYESGDAGGGLFSLAIADVIAGKRSEYDLDKNGMIEISEVLRGVKQKVVVDGRSVREAVAKRQGWPEVGTQTPWIARNLMVGDFSLF